MINSSSISATVSNGPPKRGGRVGARLCLVLLALLAASPANASDSALSVTLDSIGRQVEKFWSNFASVTCTEAVTQSKLGEKGKALFVQHQTFDYLIALQSSGQDISVDESRLEKVHTGSKGKA